MISFLQWGEKDSNLRSLATTELQSVPFGHSGIPPFPGNDVSIRDGEGAKKTWFAKIILKLKPGFHNYNLTFRYLY
jgi:hypothetical protein